MGGPKVREVMTDRPRCITPETPVSEAARLMKSEDVGSLPILDGERLTGIVTDRDIVLQAVAEEKDPRGMPVREVASRDLVTVGQDEDLSEALKRMASNQLRRIPSSMRTTGSWALLRRLTSPERQRTRTPARCCRTSHRRRQAQESESRSHRFGVKGRRNSPLYAPPR